MDFIFNGFAVVLLVSGVLTILLSTYIYRKGGETVKWLSLMMYANAVWSFSYGLELASTSLNQAIIFINLQYLGIATLPLFWFLFSLSFCGKECWYKKKKNLLLILIFPIATIIMVWSNPYHHLHYKSISMDLSGPFPMASFTTGIWYSSFVTYFYLLLAAGCFLVLRKFKSSGTIYRKQNYSIVIAISIPWIANLLYLLGFRPLGHVDATPFTFILATLLVLISIYRFKLFDIIPIAREKVLELMQDGFLVLDQKNRIIDYNKAILNFLNFEKGHKIIGTGLEQILPNQPDFDEIIRNRVAGKFEITLNKNGEEIHLEADVLFIDDNKINSNFCIIKVQDQTASKKDAVYAREQSTELQKLNALKDRIFTIISHDLRGPLVNLSEILKMLANDQISNEEFKILSPTLSKDIIYTTDLLENILHWSRSQLKGFGLNKEFFNLRNLIINEINYHLPAANLKEVKIIHDVFPGEMVYADMLMVQIVVRNIINNAIKFTSKGCEILINAAYQKDQTMLICIKDNGVGIAKDVLEKLFKEENITTRGTSNEKGTGLGLMVCKDFMKRNDGNISVKSELGVGTEFCITIPTVK